MAEQMVLTVVAIALLGGAIVGDLLDHAARRRAKASSPDEESDPDE
jgi:hypothetical protein